MQPYKLRELLEALRSMFSKPFTVRYPSVPSPSPEGFRGMPEFEEKNCMGCGACAEICPGGAIRVIDGRDVRRIELFYGSCTFCALCEKCCPVEGIKLTQEYKLVFTDKKKAMTHVEKPLVRCELCGNPLTTLDHLRWLINRLGPLAFSNGTLVSLIYNLTSGREARKAMGREADRSDVMRVLCPECRRKVAVIDHAWRGKY